MNAPGMTSETPVSGNVRPTDCVRNISLPVAPRAFARSRFAPDARPAQAMTPGDALNWLEAEIARGCVPESVNISGPGDPLAAPGAMLDTLRLAHARLPEADMRITSLGMGIKDLAKELADAGLSSAELLCDAVDPELYAKLYAWIRPGVKNVPLAEAARTLAEEQALAVAALAEAGVAVTVATTVFPGLNGDHIAAVAEKMAELGAGNMILRPFRPEPGLETDVPAAPSAASMATLAGLAGKYLPVSVDFADGDAAKGRKVAAGPTPLQAMPKPSKERPYAAVCSLGGFDVDQHLGHAHQYLIYGEKDGLVSLLEVRPAPEPGSGTARWEEGAATLSDCFALAAQSAGESPRKIFGRHGIRVLVTDGNVEGVVDALFGGGKGGKGRSGRASK